MLPFSTHDGHVSFIDALFTSTSAVCVTGLIVQDTATFFTPPGQVIILFLFQLGGLGIMTFSTLILLVAGRKISITDRINVQEEFHHSGAKNFSSLVRNIFFFTLSIELVGTLFLFLQWAGRMPKGKALFQAFFHSVSAFCNAGFSTFSNSFEDYAGHTGINLILIGLIILGGMGFLVLQECRGCFRTVLAGKRRRMSLHSKMVLSLTLALVTISLVLFLVLEWNKSLQEYAFGKKVLMGLFQVVTPRTAGFNSMNLNTLSVASVALLICLMFIGASPGSTGGGLKTSTVGVITAFMKSKILARASVQAFKRTLPQSLIMKAFTVLTLAVGVIFVSSFVLFVVQPELSMKEILFEIYSAFGTVGLSLGVTPKLGPIGKIVVILTMYVGRIGPITLLYAFSRRRPFGKYEYQEESVMIG